MLILVLIYVNGGFYAGYGGLIFKRVLVDNYALSDQEASHARDFYNAAWDFAVLIGLAFDILQMPCFDRKSFKKFALITLASLFAVILIVAFSVGMRTSKSLIGSLFTCSVMMCILDVIIDGIMCI
jgi:hypothetical protein